ncbi:DUF6566 family protein [Burkholderia sp. Ac-20365]|uniref:DUF6566 family protein n=1 Tax=Burkholderia sp. Ac-20365 TaxID=2703897 RepID=UPI00321717C8
MADITRQLAGSAAVETGFVEAPLAAVASAHDAAPVFDDVQRAQMHAPLQVQGAEVALMVPDAPEARDEAGEHDERDERIDAGTHTPLWMSLTTPRGLQVADRQGYTIYVVAEPVPDDKFRAWAEIMKDGKRVERSGLIGPRFADADAAHRFALDWARQWIDRECRTFDAAAGLHASVPGIGAHAPKAAVRPVSRAMPELTPTPVLAAANVAAVAATAAGNPHLPQHLNPRLMPLRRYPADAAKDKTGERYPLPSNLLSHVG